MSQDPKQEFPKERSGQECLAGQGGQAKVLRYANLWVHVILVSAVVAE